MSVINKMLQDLDRRQANAGGATRAPRYVKVVRPGTDRRIAFWASLGVLIAVAIGWAGWVGYQLYPRPLATPAAFASLDSSRTHQVVVAPPPPPAPVAVVAPPPPPPAVVAPVAPAPAPAAPQPDMLRLADSIQTPLPAVPEAKPEPKAEPKPAPVASKPQPKPVALPKAQQIPAATTAADKPRLERREVLGTLAERAENEFLHAAGLLKAGRSAEAESRFMKALDIDMNHRGARQALVALQLERGQLETARKLLQDGLALDAAQPEFAITLARIYAERRDYWGALTVLERSAGAAAHVPEFHVLRGTLLQRLGRHAEAAEAYQSAVQGRAALPQAWVGLGISLEALNRRTEAADAFRKALAAGPVSADVKTFAEQRIRALR